MNVDTDPNTFLELDLTGSMEAYLTELAEGPVIRAHEGIPFMHYGERTVELIETDVQLAAKSNPQWIYYFA